jgi:putative ABC transport system permease protein
MLTIEGTIMAGLGGALGIVFGVRFGWAGTYLLLSMSDAAAIAVNPAHLGGTVAISVVAGLAASVSPSRAAAKAQPAAALAVE